MERIEWAIGDVHSDQFMATVKPPCCLLTTVKASALNELPVDRLNAGHWHDAERCSISRSLRRMLITHHTYHHILCLTLTQASSKVCEEE